MQRLRKIADRLIGLSATIGALGLLVEMLVILVDVIGRAVGRPLHGSQNLISMTMVLAVFGGMALCDQKGGHISVDLFEQRFPPVMTRFIDICAAILGAAIFLTIALTVYDSSKISQLLNLSTNLLNLPKAWFQWALCGIALITSMGMLLRAVELALRAAARRRDRTKPL